MKNKRITSWSMAMRDIRSDRARRAGVREERLRATAGLRSGPALTSWRGRSGRRYVVGIHPLHAAEISDVSDAVLLAVARDGEGTSTVLAMTILGPRMEEEARQGWLARVRQLGATELHVHRLAYDDQECRAVMADLNDDTVKAAC